MDLRQHWAAVEQRLRAARDALIASTTDLAQFEEYLQHNELELALDELEALAERELASPAFWSEMQHAADAIELHGHAARYRLRLGSTEPNGGHD